jgi:type II secretory pathway pseudopilin PulG
MNPYRQKLLLGQLIPKQPDGGFTLLEALVSILAATIFVAMSLQAMTMATLAQLRAREEAEAMLFIQRRLEEARDIAANLAANPALCTAGNATQGYADALRDAILGADSADAVSTEDINPYLEVTQKTYSVTTTMTPSSLPPHAVLQLNYQVIDPTINIPERQVLAQLNSEVIPNAALQCP